MHSYKINNVLAYAIIFTLFVFGIVLTYVYTHVLFMQVIAWGAWVVFAVALLYFTDHGQNTIVFLKDAKVELNKVIWPSRKETQQVTVLVMVIVALASLILWFCDAGMIWIVGKITHLN